MWLTFRGGLWALLGLAMVTGCASLSYTVNNNVFSEMSNDKKLRLFDAENEVSLAEDEAEQMRLRARDLSAEARAAGAQGGDTDPEIWGPQTEEMWDRRIEFLEASHDYLWDRLEVQASVIVAAQAKFELAKALLLKKNRLSGAERLDVHKFELQAQAAAHKSEAAREALSRNKPRLERIRQAWRQARETVLGSTLPVIGLPGDEEIPVWEIW